MPLSAVFINLTKAFNMINKKALWTVREQIGFPQRFVKIIYLFHDGMIGRVFSMVT